VSIRQIVAICLTYATAITAAAAQSTGFVCPKAGTVEQRAVSTVTYNGSSPEDPAICMLTNRLRKPEQRLYNLFLLSNINNNASAMAPIKAGMSDILSGRKTGVTFPAMEYNGYITTNKWTFVRREPLTVGNKTFNTLVLDREVTADPRARSDFHGHYMMWIDPAAGIWLKVELSAASGATRGYPQSSRVHAITP